jgi:hypothetical protein
MDVDNMMVVSTAPSFRMCLNRCLHQKSLELVRCLTVQLLAYGRYIIGCLFCSAEAGAACAGVIEDDLSHTKMTESVLYTGSKLECN